MSETPSVHRRVRVAWMVLTGVLAVEAIGGVFALVTVVQSFLAASTDPLGQRLSVLLAAVIAWAWVVATLWGAARLRAGWARGSALTLHVLLFAAGTGVLQFQLGSTALGFGLIALAFAGFAAALLAKPFVAEADE